jgi:hypothetical protein
VSGLLAIALPLGFDGKLTWLEAEKPECEKFVI